MVTRENGYHGPHFRATHSTTQGELASPTLFNIVVNSVISNWISLIVEDKLVIQDGLVHAVG